MTKFCECGCGSEIKDNQRCINGHRNKIKIKEWTKEELINKVQEIFKEKQLKKSDFWNNFNLYNLPSMNVINKLFSSLDDLAIEANIIFAKGDRAKYLVEHPEIKEKIIANSNIFKKSIKYEERYGLEKSKQIKSKISNSCIGRKPHNKNKTYEQSYGKIYAEKILLNNKIKHIIYTDEYLINRIKEIFNIYGQLTKSELDRKYKELNFCCITEIRNRFNSTDNLAKLAGVEFRIPEFIFVYTSGLGKKKGNNEDIILDMIERIYDLKLERHRTIFTKKGFRVPDAIDHKNKVIYEVDEKYHEKIKENDKKRETEILEIYPDYRFIRINEKEFLDKFSQQIYI